MWRGASRSASDGHSMALRLRSASQKFRKSVLCPRSAPSTKRFHTRRRAECLLWVISGGGGELGLRSGLPLTADLAAAEELFGWSRQRTSGEVHQNREVNRGTADGELRFVPVNLGRSLCALLPSLSSFCCSRLRYRLHRVTWARHKS